MPTPYIEERRATYAGFTTRELTVGGTGPMMVLIHGFAHSADVWRPVLHLLHDAGQSAVAVDLPGFGIADPLRFGELMPQLDAFMTEVIRHYGVSQRVVLVGNSLGAALVARAARTKDLPIGAVMPLGIAGLSYTALVSQGLVPLVVSTRRLSGLRIPSRAHRAITRRALSIVMYGRPSAVDPEVVAAFADTIPDLASASRLLRLGAKFINELDRTPQLGGINVPMTVVHGRHDRLVSLSASRALHKANPGSRLLILGQAGHCPQLDAARDVVYQARELARSSTDTKEIS